ncbi:MAG: rRNA maturation RNase YbeY [Leptolyngbya sp. LCM1.Bin17]|nr:MAG: rRNA maturation RNase YbeY [Leptolyngbya sp. LCM1.Bin17]
MISLDLALEFSHPQAEMIPEADWRAWFDQWAEQMALTGSPIDAYELSLTLTTDSAIAALNYTFRQLDQPTDVLSFADRDLDSPLATDLLASEPLYLGDIIISLDTAQRQAQAAGHSLRWEMVWLAAHGFLHLLGWDHPDDDSLAAMLHQQTALLETVGLIGEN